MIAATPQALWLLLPVAGALLLQFRAARKRTAALERFARDGTRPHLVPTRQRGKEGLRGVLRYGALLLCVVALLRPQGGPSGETGSKEGLDILIALDCSRSMLADDLPPNRLAAAKGAIQRLTSSLRGDRIGLLLFAGSSFLSCPLTTDYAAFTEVLNQVDAKSIPRGGTSLAAPREGALGGFKGIRGNSRVLILVTDGEEHEGDPRPPLQALRAAGIRLVTVAVGSAQGGLIPQGGGYLKDRRGNVVKSSLHAASLRALAEEAGGTMITMNGAESLPRLYEERLSTLPKRSAGSGGGGAFQEWYQLPLAAASILLLLELLVAVRGRR